MEAPGHKARPALIVQRDAAIAATDRFTVAPITSTIRRLPTCVPLGPDEGLDRECVANFDSLAVMSRRHEICVALRAFAGC